MAYNAKQLARQTIGAASATGASGTSSNFVYRTTEAITAVLAAGYWNSARGRFKVGDTIDAICSVGGTPTWSRLIVTSIPAAPSNVVVAELGVTGIAGANYKVARGQHTTVAAADTVVTGLATVVAVVASLDDDPVDGAMHVSATIGDQAGSPAAGSVIIKGWKSTDADATLIAATTFTKKVNWIAFGA
ncbi:MAG TPA: hypothetical protein VGB90_09745 [Alphaproteobacteria bacterium]|jgi:hypothetical protein